VPAMSKTEIAERVIAAIGPDVREHGPFDENPFLIEIDGAVPLAIFPFTITNPPGGRHASELKIQLIAPGQARDEPGNFAPPPGRWPILLGYSEFYDRFVLWEAQKHVDFGWSKNCQVRIQVLSDAQISGIANMDRNLHGGLRETIIAARPDHLADALKKRIKP